MNMRTTFCAAFLAVACALPVHADSLCCTAPGDSGCATSGCATLCDTACQCTACDCERWFLVPQSDCGLNLHGWIDAGYIWNTSNPNSKFNGPYNAVDRSNEPMMNQLYFVAEQDLPCCGHGFGGRIDFLYGEDFFLAESIGIEKRPDGSPHWNPEYYGIAFPQAYGSFGNQQLWLQVGRRGAHGVLAAPRAQEVR